MTLGALITFTQSFKGDPYNTSLRLGVVLHFPSGIAERAKRERA